MGRDEILARVNDLPAEFLYEAIIQGTVTLDDLKATGDLDASKRLAITKQLKQREAEDENAWARASQAGDEYALEEYKKNFPSGLYVVEADRRLASIRHARDEAHRSRAGILDKIRRSPNKFRSHEIMSYLQNGALTISDLRECQVPERIIDTMMNDPVFSALSYLGNAPESIPTGFTEIYFWGVPGSGKTCALGAILNAADRDGMINIVPGPGYDYMTRLKNIFLSDVALLPPPTPNETTQYLPFTLKGKTESAAREVSLIELSGEIFECFFYKNAGLEFPSEHHQRTFDLLMRFLRGDNRKIHFFFVDYGSESALDANGRTQSDYLSAASTYFANTENRIFNKLTDAIYIVLTKSDLMPCAEEDRYKMAADYLQSPNFSAFTNALKDNCRRYSINGGSLPFEPFSLGKVYFKNFCEFDNRSAKRIVSLMVERIRPKKKGFFDIFNQ